MSQQEIESLFGGSTEGGSTASKVPTDQATLQSTFAEGSKDVESPSMYAAMQLPAGINQGMISAIGMPVDLINWGMRQVGLPVSEKPFGGSEYLKEKAGMVGIEPDKYPARNKAERIIRAGGEGIGMSVVPQAAVEAAAPRILGQVAKTPTGITARETAERVFGARAPGSVAATAENAAINAAGGVGAQTATEFVPDRWKALAGMAGGMAGAAPAALAIEGAKTLPKMGRAAFEYLQPIFNPEAEAARRFGEGVTNRTEALERLKTAPRSLIEGSEPTTFEMAGDQGLGQLQRRAETQNPAPFIERRGEQATARQAALEGVAPEGSPMEVPKLLGAQLDALQNQENAMVRQAEERARAEAERLGGNITPEQAGELLRKYTQEAKDKANETRRQLYDTVEQNGDLNVVATPVRDAADRMAAEASSLAKPLEGEAAAVVAASRKIDDVIPFSDLRALDTRVTDAMREELRTNGETNTYRRLVQLKDSVMDAMNNAVDNQAKYEAEQVRAGRMAAEDTLEERLRGLWGVMGGKEPAPKGAPLEPNLTPQAIADLEAAKAGHKEYVGKFREGPVGEVLKPGMGQGQYKVAFDAQVGPKFFRSGDTGFEAAEAFKRAVSNDKRAMDTMNDYIVSRAFSESRDPKTGLIDPKRFDAWKSRNESALRSFPEVAEKLSSASAASEAAMETAARSRSTIEAAQKTEVAKLIGATDPETVSKSVGQIFGQKNAQQTMRNLVEATRGNPDALQGLQRAVADFVRTKFISVAEEGTSEARKINSASFQKFVRDNRKTLEQVFDKDQVNTMQALADDLNRSARSVTGSGLAGRSTTAQDVSPAIKEGQSLFDKAVKGLGAIAAPVIGGSTVGAASGPLAGFATFASIVGAEIVGGMRAAGMQRADDLITEALLNPELGRKLLMQAPKKAEQQVGRGTGQSIANTIITGAKQPFQGNTYNEFGAPVLTIRGPANREGRATGGAVNLMALSKAAKKQVTKVTEPLLNESDDSVAHALEVANKHI